MEQNIWKLRQLWKAYHVYNREARREEGTKRISETEHLPQISVSHKPHISEAKRMSTRVNIEHSI